MKIPLRKCRLSTLCCAAAITIGSMYSGYAQDTASSIQSFGYAWWELGQIVRGEHFRLDGKQFERQWLHRAFVNIAIKKTLNEHLALKAGMEAEMWFNSFPWQAIHQDILPSRNFSAYPTWANGIFTYGDPGKASIQAELGLFRFKYNPEVRNLGEFLFRTGTYPQWMRAEFDFPMAQLSGLHIASDLFNCIHQDLLLTSELEMRPFYDWSLSYIASYSPHSLINFGAGVQFARVAPIDDRLTTPNASTNMYITNKQYPVSGDSSIFTGDTGYYSFKGTKVMSRVTIDPKQLFPIAAFGKEDLKIYAEAAILGLKNYPELYDTLLQRIPVMFGMNIPTFKLLDILCFEAEWYGSHYPNSYYTQLKFGFLLPKPDNQMTLSVPHEAYLHDNWKWTIYAKKTILNSITFVAQAARDHMRTTSTYDNFLDPQEALIRPNDWCWLAKIMCSF